MADSVFTLRLRSQPFYGNGTETERELFYDAYCMYINIVLIYIYMIKITVRWCT